MATAPDDHAEGWQETLDKLEPELRRIMPFV